MFFTSSRARGEADEQSDYDVAITVKSINSFTIKKIRAVSQRYPNFSAYLLSSEELHTSMRGQLLQFYHSEKLYGDVQFELPSKEEVMNFISYVCYDCLDSALILLRSRMELR